ncbi:MAG: diadenylate cyclase [Sedimentisphaerales bacterium]|nr:diadenylate cyclase [Sedimentisphaerales bacterium]
MAEKDIIESMKSSGYYITDGHFRLISGKHSDTYVQARLSLMDPEIRKSFLEISCEVIKDTNPTAVAGFTIGGLLLAEALANYLKIQLIIGRKRPKGIEWLNKELLKSKTRLILVDDVLTTPAQINRGISSLEDTDVGAIIAILIAVDRSATNIELSFRGQSIPLYRCARLPLTIYDPSTCHLCRVGIPPTDLSNPETNFISVIMSQPPDKFDFILKGYEKIYIMQEESQLIDEIKAWKPWLPVLLAGLPIPRMEEDSRLIRFVSHLTLIAEAYKIRLGVLSEIVGQLVSLSSIRVESRPVGCSILIGDNNAIKRILESKARVKLPYRVSCEKLTNMVPHFDAFLETNYVMVLDNDGNILDLRRLISNRPKPYLEGIELLRFVTLNTPSIGFVLRRGRCAISVYWKGRLEAVGELSQRSGLWEFSRPMERIDEIEKIPPRINEFLVTVIEVGRELVAKGHGALFIIGDISGLKYTSPKIEIEAQFLNEISTDDLVELAKLDGATIIDNEGKLVLTTVIIENKEEDIQKFIPAFKSMHGGSRKDTARRTSIECPGCAAIYISQNGAIEVYVQGKSWSIAEAITGLSRA